MKTHLPNKSIFLPLGLAMTLAGVARADFIPIPLTQGSFNKDIVIEKTATPPAQTLVTANMDAGTNTAGTTGGNGGNQGSMYERGFGATGGTGLPYHGAIFTATGTNASNHKFQMGADYTVNNALYVGTYGGITQVLSGTLTLTVPTAFTHLSVLDSAGNGPVTLSCTVHYQDGNAEVVSIAVQDWFTQTSPGTNYTAWICNGKFQGSDGTFTQVNSANAQQIRLFYNDVALGYAGSVVTSIDFAYVSGGRAGVYGLAGSADGGLTYTPVAVTGFNADMIVENKLLPTISATLDGGTNRNGNTWYEVGYNLINAGLAWTGIPLHGSTFTAWSNANYSFTMPATYVGNNAVMIGNFAGYTTGTLTLTTPGTYTNLAILSAAGNGPVVMNYTIHHADSSTETGSVSSPDWFATSTNVAYSAAGRVPVGDNRGISNGGARNTCLLWYSDIPVTTSASAVTSVDFTYVGGGRSSIFALSGSDGTSALQTPIAINTGGYNADVVVEAQASTNLYLRYFSQATMDGGTNNNGNTWYERGYDPYNLLSGLPAPGSIITSTNLPDHKYQFASTYTGPNAVYCDSNNPVANITFATPAAYSGISFLSGNANGGIQIVVVITHAGGATETNFFNSLDWFNGVPAAFTAAGRVNGDNGPGMNNWAPVSTNPRFYEAQFALQDPVTPVTGAMLIWTTNNGTGGISGTTSRFVVMAVSGTTGALTPIIATHPTNVMAFEGSNFVDSVKISGGATPMTFQWQRGPAGSGVFTNVPSGGSISGTTSSNIVFTSAGWTNTADYRCIAANIGGSVTSLTATITVYSGLPDVTQPTDTVIAYQPNGGNSSAAEVALHVIDNVAQKYYNAAAGTLPFVGPIGFVVSPSGGVNSIVSALRIYTANDAADRDPADYVLEGSNDGGASWTTIASGPLNLPTGRNSTGANSIIINPSFTNFLQEVHFANTIAYKTYRWSANNVRNNTTVVGMQIGEIEFLGSLAATPPIITVQPVPNVKVFVGGNPAFNVAAFGYPTNLSYRWYSNNVAIPGATAASYTLASAQLSDSGKTFACVVTNLSGSVTSAVASLTVIAAPTTSYPTTVLGDNPLAFFRLDEGPDNGTGNSGVVAQDLWGGHNGMYTNVTLGAAGYPANPADPDTATMFGSTAPFAFVTAGLDSCVRDIPGIDFATPTNQSVAFSVEAWVKQDPNVSAQTYDAGIVTKGYGGGGEQFNLDTGGNGTAHTFRWFVHGFSPTAGVAGPAFTVTVTNTPADGLWHHLVGVCDEPNSNVLFYVDGLLRGTAPVSPSNGLQSSTYPVSIGGRPQTAATNYNLMFYGTVDEVAIYNKALSSNQVLSHYYASGVAPAFVVQPSNTVAAEGTIATFYSQAYGTPTLSYQWWQSDGAQPTAIMTGRTTPNLSLTNVTSAQNFSYYQVVVSSAYGGVTSAPVYLQVISGPPQFSVDLLPNYVAYAGSQMTLSVSVVGTAPFTYGWYKDGTQILNSGRITGANSNVLTIGTVLGSDVGNYQIFATNSFGTTPSLVGTLTVVSRPDFSNNGLGWTLNGGANIDTNTLTVTDGAGNETRSCFFNFPVYIGAFKASYTYQDIGGGGADGTVFVVQNDPRGTAALGGGGGSMGYGATTPITPSAGLEFNIYANNTVGMALRANGATGAPYSPTTPVNLAGGNPIDVSLYYASGVMSVTMTDAVAAVSFTTNIVVGSLPGIVGGPTAYVGITGATGGTASTQKVSKFLFTSLPSMSTQLTGTNSLVITWPASVGGYVLKQSASLDTPSWQDVPAQVTVVNGQNQVVITPLTGTQFYRLVLQ